MAHPGRIIQESVLNARMLQETKGLPNALGETAPFVTYHMLLDFLDPYTVLLAPHSSKREFRWLLPLSQGDLSFASIEDAHVLYVCHLDTAKAILEQNPEAFVLALNRKTDIPPWVTDYGDHVLLVQQNDRFAYFCYLVQEFFTTVLLWKSELDRIVASRGALSDLLAASEPMLGNFIAITDRSYGLITHTEHIACDEPPFKHLMETGCYDGDTVKSWKRRLAHGERALEITGPNDELPFAVVGCPIILRNVYFAHVVMACNHQEPTEGVIDLFNMLVRKATALCEGLFRRTIQAETTYHPFFNKLLSGEQLSDGYVSSQLAFTDIPARHQLKCMILDIGSSHQVEHLTSVIEAARNLGHGDSYCISHDGNLVVLLYAEEGDSEISTNKVLAEYERIVYRPFKIPAGCSQIFDDVRDLKLAFRQAQLALKLQDVINAERRMIDETPPMLYTFEDIYLYFLVTQGKTDKKLLRFSLSHTLLEKIGKDDRENGTEDAKLLWCYLFFESNATAVAKHLHMHRNTVLYHIDKIQKRFDFDLSNPNMRNRLLIDFKVYFLTQGYRRLDALQE